MTRPKPQPTAQDVARVADVSTATVSRYFSDRERIRPATAQRIAEAIEQLGYVPDLNARALASRRSPVIGAVVPTLENAIFAEGIEAMQGWLNQKNITLLVASTGYNPENEFQQVQKMIAHGVSGLMLIGTARLDKTLYAIKQRSIPFCLTWCYQSSVDEPQIGFDNFQAGYDLAQKIQELGHTKAGIIAGVRSYNDRATDRVEGVCASFRERGQTIAEERIIEVKYDHAQAAEALDIMLGTTPDLSCIVCGNDVIAAGVLKQAHRRGIKVPEQLSITGFDDIALADVLTPSLTTVHLPHRHMGEVAGQSLLEAIESGSAVNSRKIPYSICLRESLIKAS